MSPHPWLVALCTTLNVGLSDSSWPMVLCSRVSLASPLILYMQRHEQVRSEMTWSGGSGPPGHQSQNSTHPPRLRIGRCRTPRYSQTLTLPGRVCVCRKELFYLLEKQSEAWGQGAVRREKERPSICWFFPQMTVTVRADPG